ncbi:MAG: hypothetical protein L7F78_02580 [Syntrophales bacterium LBB04]|nr:hypothetical protein [Syntrophales bacterium LBB04]
MKKSILVTSLWIYLVFSFFSLAAHSAPPAEKQVTGILHLGPIPSTPQPFGSIHQAGPLPNETGYWLKLDNPIYVLKGTKSEASTDSIVLRLPVSLQGKAKELEGKQINAVGTLKCTGNWREGAICELHVKQIEQVNDDTQKSTK